MPEWNWAVELGTAVLRDQLRAAFALPDIVEQRRFLDCLVLGTPSARRVTRTAVDANGVRGTWHVPENRAGTTMLYLHGGGFAVYPQEAYANFLALLATATRAAIFALDYRLAPEHPFPAATDDAQGAYRWLLESGLDPARLVVGGDSAGGNLALVLVCELRDRRLPLPALAVALSPATEFDTIRPSMTAHAHSDWIGGEMALAWRDWYCRPEERSDPRVSPIHADLRGLPLLYLQAGEAEILYDSVVAFAEEARRQGAAVRLESWPGMNHVFQFFGDDAPQSAAALRRIGEVMAETVGAPSAV